MKSFTVETEEQKPIRSARQGVQKWERELFCSGIKSCKDVGEGNTVIAQ